MDKRNTKQKQIITDAILSLYHPTSDDIIKKVNEMDPTIGRATIFRTITSLIEDNIIQKIYLDKRIVYDTITITHNHFVCTKCNRIIDLNNNIEHIINNVKLSYEGIGEISNTSITYYGLCEECKNNK